ncbi:hypothetical protein [Tardiphaga sp. 841_E9_N1_2]|uniref:hypothetical protein n=1 Tax=Tardiphaga sp. 841_E9_N1_2 TaxID=3240762 RepID=UPI003F23EF79
MAEQKFDDGGPAFPRANDDYAYGEKGMSMRDWFAGQSMPAILAVDTKIIIAATDRLKTAGAAATMAMMAYEMADAMIVERAKAYAATAEPTGVGASHDSNRGDAQS